MSENEDFDLSKLVGDVFPKKMISNWIVVAEIVTDNNKFLAVDTSEDLSLWLASGMLRCAEEIIREDHLDFEFEGVEDEE